MPLDSSEYSIPELTEMFRSGSPQDQMELIACLSVDGRKGARDIISKHIKIREKEQRERQRLESMMKYEKGLQAKGFKVIAGADEAGRGALAGPLVAAAVILPQDCYIRDLKDSKKLSKEKRDCLFPIIIETALSWSVKSVANDVIDRIGIQVANMSVLAEAVNGLDMHPDYVLTDGFSLKDRLDMPSIGLVRGDSLSVSIAAASIIAKVVRDRMMHCLNDSLPQFDFRQHVGYGTAMHFALIAKNGISRIHRRTFLQNC